MICSTARRTALALTLALALAGAFILAAPAGANDAPGAATAGDRLFIFVYRPGPAWEDGKPLAEQGLRPHGLYMKSLFDEGRIFAAGPFTDRDGGLVILRAADMGAARAVYDADPAVESGKFVGEIMAWDPRFNGSGPLVEP